MTECIIPLSGNETIRDTLTYEYKYTYYDYISINTMKMFVVRRYWNMVSIYIYICCHAHMYICILLCVYMHFVCVCGHALYSGILERLRLHFAEAFGPSRFGGKMFVRSRFPMAFSQMNDRLLEMEAGAGGLRRLWYA